jgi:hypothetical protein
MAAENNTLLLPRFSWAWFRPLILLMDSKGKPPQKRGAGK